MFSVREAPGEFRAVFSPSMRGALTRVRCSMFSNYIPRLIPDYGCRTSEHSSRFSTFIFRLLPTANCSLLTAHFSQILRFPIICYQTFNKIPVLICSKQKTCRSAGGIESDITRIHFILINRHTYQSFPTYKL